MNHCCCTGTHTPQPKCKESRLGSLIGFKKQKHYCHSFLVGLLLFSFCSLICAFTFCSTFLLCALLLNLSGTPKFIKYNLLILKQIVMMITTPITCPNTVNLASFHCNGLSLAKKRIKKFQNLKKLNSIIFLQETHCTKNFENKWRNDWTEEIHFSNGNSSGVAILLPKNMDLEGRHILLKIKYEDSLFILFNVYAPTQEHKQDQINFIIKLKTHAHTIYE